MLSQLRRALAFTISFTLLVPSYGFARTDLLNPVRPIGEAEIIRKIDEANTYGRVVDTLKSGPNQYQGSLAPDRFLLMEQKVNKLEIAETDSPIPYRGQLNQLRRRAMLESLSHRVVRFLGKTDLNTPLPVLNGEELLEQSKAVFKDAIYVLAQQKPLKKAGPKLVAAMLALSDPEKFIDVGLSFLTNGEFLTPEQSAAVQSISGTDAKLNKFQDILFETMIRDYIAEGRRQDTPFFVYEKRDDRAQLARVFDILQIVSEKWNANKSSALSNYTEAKTIGRTRYINWWNTSLRIVRHHAETNQREILREIPLRNTATGRQAGSVDPISCVGAKCTFEIVQDGVVLNTINIPFNSITAYDKYIVFDYENSYDAPAQTQNLLFMDLGAYSGLIGNEDIPVFRLPLQIEEPVQALGVVGGQLILNEKWNVTPEFFAMASGHQQIIFNLLGQLLSADTWEKVAPLIDSVRSVARTYLAQEIAVPREELAGYKAVQVDLAGIAQTLEKVLAVQANARNRPLSPANKSRLGEIVDSLKDPADTKFLALRTYHEGVMKSAALAKAMRESQVHARTSKQLAARVTMLMGSLVSPRPNISPRIKEAISGWYVTEQLRSGRVATVADALVKLIADRPWLTASAIAAGVMSAAAPETFHTLTNGALQAANGLGDYTVGLIRGIGEASRAGVSASFAPLTTAGGALKAQYYDNGALVRTLLGLATFSGALGAIYFVPHMVFNYMALRRDMKKASYAGFVQRQRDFTAAYLKRLADDEAASRQMEGAQTFSRDEDQAVMQFLATRKIADRSYLRRALDRLKRPAISDALELAQAQQNAELQVGLDATDKSEAAQLAARDPEQFRDEAAFIKNTVVSLPLKDEGQNLAGDVDLDPSAGKVDTSTLARARALKDFMFSSPALELTLERWANIWNNYAMFRFATVGFVNVTVFDTKIPVFIKVKPVSFAAKLLFPRFMPTVIWGKPKTRVIPSVANGGLDVRLAKSSLARGFGDWFSTLGRATSPEFAAQNGINRDELQQLLRTPGVFNPKRDLAELQKFESGILDVESQISEEAFRKSLKLLADEMTNQKDIHTLFTAKPLQNIVQSDIKDLSYDARTFLRTAHDSIYNAAMNKFLSEEIDTRRNGDSAQLELPLALPPSTVADEDPSQASAVAITKALKAQLVALHSSDEVAEIADYNFDPERAKQAALSVIDDPAHAAVARLAVENGRWSVTNFVRNTKYDLVSDYDPQQNPSMLRLEKVHERLQKPGALARAVRAEITKLMLTLPIDLSLKMFLTAGITSGSMKPIQDSMFSSNSIMYFSILNFYVFTAFEFAQAMMGDAWIKLQNDARQDDLGEFGQIPRGEDADRSALRWYFKQVGAKQNSLWSNYKMRSAIGFRNLPAALFNISLFRYFFSGRVDISLLVSYYVVLFGTPKVAIETKFEQGFERSVHYVSRGIKDEKWMAHPAMIEYFGPQMQKARTRFNMFFDVWEAMVGDIKSNIELIGTSIGPRGFQRALFGGGLLEEYLVNGVLQPIAHSTNPVVKVLKPLAGLCQNLLTSGNHDLIRIRK